MSLFSARKKFLPTISTEELVKEGMKAAQNDPFESFEKYPFRVVREKCLEEMSRYTWDVSSGLENWTEDAIQQFKEEHDRIWIGLLSWYIRCAKDTESTIHALKFAFIVSARNFVSEISKPVIAVLMLNSACYDPRKLSLLRQFIGDILDQVTCAEGRGSDKPAVYNDKQWGMTLRALKLVVTRGDCEFLPKIEKIIELIETRKIEHDTGSRFDKDTELAILRMAREKLKDVQTSR